MTFSLALIGCGGMGLRHIKGMKRLQDVGHMAFELTATCDLFAAASEKAADFAEEQLGKRPKTYTDLGQLLNDGVDGVIITTTPETHAAIGIQAMEAGCHVLTEKPITLTVSQGRRLVGKAQETGLKLSVAENYRRDPINRLARALIDAGAIGRVFMAAQTSSGSGERVIITPWRHLKNRGGILLDMGVHYADILEYFVGDAVSVVGMNALVDEKRVDADGESHNVDAEDVSVGIIRHANGAISNWMLSLAGRGEGHFNRMIWGTSGTLNLPGDRNGRLMKLTVRQNGEDKLIAEDDLLSFVPDFALDTVTAALFGGDKITTYDMPFPIVDANLLAIEQAEFVDAIEKDFQPEVDGMQGLRSLALAFGFLESEEVGKPLSMEAMLSGEQVLPYQEAIEEAETS